MPFDHGWYASLLGEARRGNGSVGGRVHFRERTISTMDDARAAAESEGLASCGTAYVAGEQEAGRGRFGRRWESPAGSALLVTYHLCGSAEQATRVTVAGALATGDALRTAAGIDGLFKWPNDVVVGSSRGRDPRKLAGILAETSSAREGRLDVLLGIGVNLRSAQVLPAGLESVAIGVVEAGGRAISAEALLAALSAALGNRWRQAADEPAALIAAWRARLVTMGQRVRLAVPAAGVGAHEVEGEAVDISPSGELVLRLADGSTSAFAAADVTTGVSPPAGSSRSV